MPASVNIYCFLTPRDKACEVSGKWAADCSCLAESFSKGHK